MKESELRFDTDVHILKDQSAQITEVAEEDFQPKRLIIERDVKRWTLFGIGINGTLIR